MEKKRYFLMPTNEKLLIKDLPYSESCVDEKSGDDVVNSWVHRFSGEKHFWGYKKVPAGPITFAYYGDCMWDTHNTIPVGGKDGKPDIKNAIKFNEWVADLFLSTMFRIAGAYKSSFRDDMMNYILMFVIFIEIVAWAIRFATGD